MKPGELPDVTLGKRTQQGVVHQDQRASGTRLSGQVVISELLRNMELGRFELAYSVLLPCAFTVYLNPEDLESLSGVLDLVAEDAKRALRARVAEWNARPKLFSLRRNKQIKEHKIACRDWSIEFLPDAEVPIGDVEIHSQLNEAAEPVYRGLKTTLMGREPTAGTQGVTSVRPQTHRPADSILAEIRYEDDSGSQIFLMTQNRIRVGRGGGDQPVDLALYVNDEVSREHLIIRREAASGLFFITDTSTNGTWLNGKRLRKGIEELLPDKAEIGVGEVLNLYFEVRK
jgi:hypothetical protein